MRSNRSDNSKKTFPPTPILWVTSEGGVVRENPAARALREEFGLDEPKDLLPERHDDLVRECLRASDRVQGETTIEASSLLWTYQRVQKQEGDGSVLHLYATDITSLREREAARRRQREQNHQIQKMEAIGRLAGGVAHDFNNLIQVILGYCSLLLEMEEQEEVREIQQAARRAASLTRQLLAFSKKQVLRPTLFDLGRAVSDMETMLRRLTEEEIEFTVEVGESVSVEADREQIQQVVLNLVSNARDALAGDGHIRVAVDSLTLKNRKAPAPGAPFEIPAGSWARVSVEDDGPGMKAAVRKRVFEPFFTTKREGKGTGLGLSTAYGIIKQSDGYIWVESEPGRGTTFRCLLPLAAEDAPTMTDEISHAEATTGNLETILLVEDDKGVRALLTRVLEKHGYQVETAPNGVKAMKAIDNWDTPARLLISDLIMPEMGGEELARTVSERYPDMKILLMSGYSDRAIEKDGKLQAEARFVQKPIDIKEFLAAVQELLGEE